MAYQKIKNILKIKKTNKLWYYEQKYLGFNYRMNDVEVALGITQIKKLNNFINSRRKIFNLYSKILKTFL